MHFRQRWFDGTSWYLMRILNMPQTYGRPFRCSASFWRAPDSFPFLWILQDISKRWLFCFSIISSRSIISRHSTKHQQFTFGSSLWSHGFTCHKKAESTTITDEDNKAMTASSWQFVAIAVDHHLWTSESCNAISSVSICASSNSSRFCAIQCCIIVLRLLGGSTKHQIPYLWNLFSSCKCWSNLVTQYLYSLWENCSSVSLISQVPSSSWLSSFYKDCCCHSSYLLLWMSLELIFFSSHVEAFLFSLPCIVVMLLFFISKAGQHTMKPLFSCKYSISSCLLQEIQVTTFESPNCVV